jgi:hypothetical protein
VCSLLNIVGYIRQATRIEKKQGLVQWYVLAPVHNYGLPYEQRRLREAIFVAQIATRTPSAGPWVLLATNIYTIDEKMARMCSKEYPQPTKASMRNGNTLNMLRNGATVFNGTAVTFPDEKMVPAASAVYGIVQWP